jgi:hypothetical protein
MNAVVSFLETLPVAGTLFKANEDKVRKLLQIEYQAWKAAIEAEQHPAQ